MSAAVVTCADTATAPLRILHVIASLDPASGGPADGLLRTSEALARLGHRTEIAMLDEPDAPYLQHVPFPVHALGGNRRRYSFSAALVPWLKRERRRFDAAVAHGLWNYASLGTWRGLAGGPTPYLIFTHGMLDPNFASRQWLKWQAKQAFWRALEGRVLRDASAVLFTTEEEKRLAGEAFPGPGYRSRVVAFGAAEAGGDASAQVAAFRTFLPRLGQRPFLLFLSRIHPKKGCDLLLDAFAKVAPHHPELDLVMAGPDQTGWQAELVKSAEALGIAGRVHWPGLIGGDVKWGAFRDCEAFVLPSHQENFGIAVAEAMACAVPVLITDKVNIYRDVEETGSGLVASDDSPGIASLLTRFLDLTPEERATMRRQARDTYLRRFGVGGAAADLVRAITEVRR